MIAIFEQSIYINMDDRRYYRGPRRRVLDADEKRKLQSLERQLSVAIKNRNKQLVRDLTQQVDLLKQSAITY